MKIRGFFAVDHPQCDVWKQKTQILIAHQKEGIDRTKKSSASSQKQYPYGLEEFAHIFGKLTTPNVMFESKKTQILTEFLDGTKKYS